MAKTLYRHFSLFDGTTDHFEPDAFFVVDDETGKIVETGSGVASAADRTVDLGNKFVMPGLINAHTHITSDVSGRLEPLGSPKLTPIIATKIALDNLKDLLKHGVTYIRDVGADFDVDIELSKLEKGGHILSPGICASGRPLAMTGGHFCTISYEVDSPDEARKAARKALKNGADNIKLMATGGVSFGGESPDDVQLTEEEMRVAVLEAHHKGRTANAHAQGTEGIKNAIRAGVDSVEHAFYLDDEAIQMFLEKGTFIVPTLIAVYGISDRGEGQVPDFMLDIARDVKKAHIESISRAAKAGIKLAMGTDAGTPNNDFKNDSAFELQLMVEAGCTPLQTLEAATVNGARLLKIDHEYGSLETEKFADFIVVDENPLHDIKTVQREKRVFKKGKEII
ncbi:amidohydrolase family protein [Sporolactobacillus shoreicorticis]|uniref:Amidohydrolase family protein n=1 Tax=Sporolactobacillus shoreicorticis TaxID=1923877 RepID=A0ABW5RZS3_9BACL|nr:amidohydrolase family protein [Sporolactobacillus shoreicorticis]MCO7127614.1 amidohydrolase family protein [Sporolactobacillus shoreicorticis]